MSLAITLANPYGIVMSADRRLTTTLTGEKESFVLTDYEQKIFLTKSGHGISYTGDASLEGNRRTSCIIRRVIDQLEKGLSLEEELLSIKENLRTVSNGQNVILIGAAIVDGRNKVFSTALVSKVLTEHTDNNGNCLAFSGESVIAKNLIDMLSCDHYAFPLQETINYLRFLTRTVSGLQHYAQVKKTVSEECDVLVIRDTGNQWVTSPDILR